MQRKRRASKARLYCYECSLSMYKSDIRITYQTIIVFDSDVMSPTAGTSIRSTQALQSA